MKHKITEIDHYAFALPLEISLDYYILLIKKYYFILYKENYAVRFELKTPAETLIELSQRAKTLRLHKKWTRATLAKKSGVPAPTLRRFKDTGKICGPCS